MNRLLLLLGAALLASSLPAQTSVWKVTRGGSTLYLGGTCHVLRASDYPLPKEYDTAFAASATVGFETDIARLTKPETQQRLMALGTLPPGTTLDQVLSPEAWAAAQRYCAQAGLPEANIRGFKPWFFTVLMAVVELQKLGVTREGVDLHYFKQAASAGKPVEGLEPFEEHLNYLANLGAGHESEMVLQSVEDLAGIPAMFSELLAAWKAGDLAKIDQLMLKDLRDKYPAIHAELIVKRNQAWLPAIEKMLRTPEAEFILVGVGHMAGPEGLVALLKARGCTVEQLVVKN